MEISLPYGSGVRKLRTPASVQTDFVASRNLPAIEDLDQAFLEACSSPVASKALGDIVSPGDRVLVVVSDLTRSKGTMAILPICIRYLRELGVPRNQLSVLVARGTHRRMTKEERGLFRSITAGGLNVKEHDCDDPDQLSALCLTTFGTPVRINRRIKESDVVILLSPVSFHYFAGFGGGRKLVLPGAAERKSILANHRLSLRDSNPVTLNPRCAAGVLDGNPIHEDMCEVIAALDGLFAINFFGNAYGDVVYLNAGDTVKSHAEACERYRESHVVPVADPYRVLIVSAGGHPYDINLVQSHKALRHAAGAVHTGGTILLVAECPEGTGSPSLENALARGKERLLKTAYKKYSVNNQTAVSLHDLTSTFEVGMVSAMNVDVLLSCGIKLCVNPEVFLAEALERLGVDRVGVIQGGSRVLTAPARTVS